ncbi:MAG: glycosyltransferase family 2 protein [Candidatus Spechtbacteria bacterium]|nr:glycosyltransferase family 2 protein [Candidatus Spechtbacteria bacterium]
MSNQYPYYLSIGRADDLRDPRERTVYRILEIIPGALVWGTFVLAFLLSWLEPLWVSVFILAFALYWIFKVVYFSFHTRSAYARMQDYQMRNWTLELDSLSPANFHVDVKDWRDLWQLIILPIYKEPYEVVFPAVEALAKNTWPREKMIVVLAMEEAGGEESMAVAERLRKEFEHKFGHLMITIHQRGLEGEIPGKGSNERWAGERAKEFIDEKSISYQNVIVSSLDSDTVVYEDYFSCVAYHYLTVEKPLRTSYQPVPFFINNIWEAPPISRVIAFSSTFWHTMNQERPEKHLTFSSHSMSFQTLVDIGFWQPNVVSEDSRVFWQAFLFYNGDYRVKSLFYPVKMDANVARSFWRTLRNIYLQQRRWAYGVADVPYFIFGYWKKRKEIPFSAFWQYAFPVIEGFYSWATHAMLLFALGWLPLFFGGDEFNRSLFSYSLPRVLRVLLTIAMIGIISSAYLSIQILPPRPPQYGKWKYVMMILQWFFIPVTLIFFGVLPAIEAHTRLMLGRYLGFWVTEKHRK